MKAFTPIPAHAKHGFSLVEAILAMTILGIAAAGILTSFSSAMIAGKLAEDYAAADSVARTIKAQVRADMLDPFMNYSDTSSSYPDFSYQVSFTSTTTTDLYRVEITVTWQRGQRQHTVNQVTYHYQPLEEAAV